MSEFFAEPNFWNIAVIAWVSVGGITALVGLANYLIEGEQWGAVAFWAGLLLPITIPLLLIVFLIGTAVDAVTWIREEL